MLGWFLLGEVYAACARLKWKGEIQTQTSFSTQAGYTSNELQTGRQGIGGGLAHTRANIIEDTIIIINAAWLGQRQEHETLRESTIFGEDDSAQGESGYIPIL